MVRRKRKQGRSFQCEDAPKDYSTGLYRFGELEVIKTVETICLFVKRRDYCPGGAEMLHCQFFYVKRTIQTSITIIKKGSGISNADTRTTAKYITLVNSLDAQRLPPQNRSLTFAFVRNNKHVYFFLNFNLIKRLWFLFAQVILSFHVQGEKQVFEPICPCLHTTCFVVVHAQCFSSNQNSSLPVGSKNSNHHVV